MHVNKVHHVTTITRIAEDLGEDEDWLRDVANEMEIEDGVIWVYGAGEDGVQAFTDFGIENLIELVRTYKENPAWQQALAARIIQSARGLRRMDTASLASGAIIAGTNPAIAPSRPWRCALRHANSS
jgi:hypothetical protein